jgi:hypothetical protein
MPSINSCGLVMSDRYSEGSRILAMAAEGDTETMNGNFYNNLSPQAAHEKRVQEE